MQRRAPAQPESPDRPPAPPTAGHTLAEQQLSALLKDPARIGWRPAQSVLSGHGISCIDGRHHGCTVAAPGGNAGELILLLAVAEWFRGAPYGDAEVAEIVDRFAEEIGPLYLHTDTDTVTALATALSVRPGLILEPPAELREQILSRVDEPRFIGCGHLRQMAITPSSYRVRRGLLGAVLRTMMQRAWDQRGVELTVLEGEHRESALVVFHTPRRVTAETMLPMLCTDAATSVFTSNVPALRFVRKRSLELLMTISGDWTGDDRLVLLLETERLGERHLDLTIARLAPELPRYRATFGAEGELELDFCDAHQAALR